MLIIDYAWPQLIFDASELFSFDDEPAMPFCHPIILGFEKCFEDFRENVEDIPSGRISFTLSCEIISDSSSWKKKQ